jgi:uncharacterized repeat protein (TIGR01451 family)
MIRPRKLFSSLALMTAATVTSLFMSGCNRCCEYDSCAPAPCVQSCAPVSCAPVCDPCGPGYRTNSWNLGYNTKLSLSQGYSHGPVNSGSFCAPCQPAPTPCTPCAPEPVCAPCAPACAPACTPAPEECANVVTINTDLVRITKKYPPRVDLNQDFVLEMTATALDNASNVVITETLPAGIQFVRSEPNTTASGDRLTWTFDSIRKGQCKTVHVYLKPTQCGEVCGCTTVTAVPFICAPVFVGCPCITCKKTGPARVNCNEPVDFMITVQNTGTAVARDVLVTENLPPEVEHASGQRVLKFPLGDLQPGETKQICVRVKALTRCIRVCNTITTTSSNCEGASCECCLDICQNIVTITKSGPCEQYICKNAEYQIVIKNEGDNDLHNVVVTDYAPNGTTIVAAPGANISCNTATWCVGVLKANEEKSFTIKLTAQTCGTYCNKASVRASDGCGADTQVCTLWKGCAGITMCVTDCEDPVCVGNFNTYKVTIRNQGVVADKNVQIVANFSPELQPISGSGPTASSVNGQVVTFKAIPALGAKQVAEYTIRAKAVAPGDARLKVSLTSDFLTKPVVDEESTQVY